MAGSSDVSGDLVGALRRARVGGTFWGPAAAIPAGRDILVCASTNGAAADLTDVLRANGWSDRAATLGPIPGIQAPALPASVDPWDACARVSLVLADGESEIALVAALSGTPLQLKGPGRFSDLSGQDALDTVVQREVAERYAYRSPYDDRPMNVMEVIALLGRWRSLIEANRAIAQIHGVARWKQITTDALLWDGTGSVRHANPKNGYQGGESDGQVIAWVARTESATLADLTARGVRIGEIEDGMIRSTGLGANCVPPLSIVVDAAGPHFDPSQASELETILQTAEIGEPLLSRAIALRQTLVSAGIGKYGKASDAPAHARPDAGRQVLVTGQVEDDRSVLCGGCGLDNLELLRRARAMEPDARIIFKPHPDVEAGHRKGHVPDAQALALADEIDRSSAIALLLDQVDAVHVLTSLAGFEALMRGCEVVTHGVPFYAGWGLTRDMGPVPERRSRTRSLDELVAATLILYPRYLDPVSRLPCEPEVLVERIAAGQAQVHSPLIRLREFQGRWKRLLGGAHRR